VQTLLNLLKSSGCSMYRPVQQSIITFAQSLPKYPLLFSQETAILSKSSHDWYFFTKHILLPVRYKLNHYV